METETMSKGSYLASLKLGVKSSTWEGLQVLHRGQKKFSLIPGIVNDLKEGLSIRKTAAFRKVSINTVQKVKRALTT
jgi:hypothetical protein